MFKGNKRLSWMKQNQGELTDTQLKYLNMPPWERVFRNVDSRCRCKSTWYAQRGIKNHLTIEDIKFLWERDCADLQTDPSIDRINPKLDYSIENCQFIEFKENCAKERRLNGRWATKYSKCVKCGSTKSKHNAYGYCVDCYPEFAKQKKLTTN